ncbi:MAG: GNAT family N-acetyltransferase [Thermoplasmata archaeon]|nr:GNAT family N-acetyltransferase [Thermoplasmata archaeon]RLF25846.1 MAG: hypothetical protein DRN01_05910 [Thermoplasmata archaeon]
MLDAYKNLVRDYFELTQGYLVRENLEVHDRKEKKTFFLDLVAVKPGEEVLLIKIASVPLDSEAIEKMWSNRFTREMERLILEETHCSNSTRLRKTVYCKPPDIEDKDINRVKSKIKETVAKRNINVVFFDEVVQQLIDYSAEHEIPDNAKATSIISIVEALYNTQPRPLIRLKRKRRIENNYTNAEELYNAAIRLHGRENMLNYLTSVYLLDSLDDIKNVIKEGGEFMVLKEDEKIIGITCYRRGVQYRSLDDAERIVTYGDAWGIPALLVDKNRRGEGYGWRLFNHALSRLKDKTREVYVPVTGTFDVRKKGKPRAMSKEVEEYCKYLDCKLVGYTPKSYGPVYLIELNYRE